jgi:putative membrane-bound dehydrogenase-like protein
MNSAAIQRIRRALPITSLLVVGLLTSVHRTLPARAQAPNPPSANWIWAPIQKNTTEAADICYFRKTFVLREDRAGWIDLACDGEYLLHVNGIKIASGSGYAQMKREQIGSYLRSGRNVVAIYAINEKPGPAGLLATITLEGTKNTPFQMATNRTWKTSLEEKGGWQQAEFLDNSWQASSIVAKGDDNQIWKKPAVASSTANEVESQVARKGMEKNKFVSRFKVTREFRVEWVVQPKDTGSLIAMTFDEFGNIIASREDGPLLLIRDMDRDGITETVTTYCKEVKNCQGILAMNGQVLVTADGPKGSGLYRLSDDDRNGVIDHIRLVLAFKGKMQEHGPHALRLGPDGMVYLLAGNLSRINKKIEPSSPYKYFYEGDLVQPRYQDPRGHANSGKAPGGVILRMDPSGSHIERFAGGLRNPYDLAFNASGDLFTWDADMEWDQGTPWYRPTRGNHVIAGAEFGWRSGSAKWPDYFVDSLPSFAVTGNGSPTGMTVYEHFMFPVRYHGSLFVGDWARGRIFTVQLKRQGASYRAEIGVFLEGSPLNITDLEVGPDGMLYFCTGGRDTEGGVYRVAWTGRVPPEVQDPGEGIESAMKQPQLHTAWSRQQIALVKEELGKQWSEQLLDLAMDPKASIARRTRAIDLLQLYGPQPSVNLLVQLSADRDRRVRTKATYFLGLHSKKQAVDRLVELVDDPNVVVQRTACESLARTGSTNLSTDKLVTLLGHGDRYLAWAAAKVLQNQSLEAWQTRVTESENQRVFLVGSAAILGTKPDPETCQDILRRAHGLMEGFVADREFIDLLRVMQIALHQGKIAPDKVPNLMQQISSEFPSGNATINRELIRLLAYLESPLVAKRYLDLLTLDLPLPEKTHLIVHTPYLIKGWSSTQQFEILRIIAEIQKDTNSPSHARYLDNVARRIVSRMSPADQMLALDRGAEWPGAALGAIAKVPEQPNPEILSKLKDLDEKLAQDEGEAASRLRIGIAAVIARSGNNEAMAYLRELFENEPERRGILAVALAQYPNDDNWPLLIRSLGVVEGGIAAEVMGKMLATERTCDDPHVIRQVILQGLKQNQDAGRRLATGLLKKWNGALPEQSAKTQIDKLTAWQSWFRKTYPDLPNPVLPEEAEGDRYRFSELKEYLESEDAEIAKPELGRHVYTQAQCIKCHRFGELGSGIGPDLTTINKRFQKKELLESIIFPSHVISDQYATKTVAMASGRILQGIVHENNDGSIIVIDPEGNKSTVAAEDIDEIATNKESTMPAGLLNSLSLEEIASLFAFLNQQPRATVSQRPDR